MPARYRLPTSPRVADNLRFESMFVSTHVPVSPPRDSLIAHRWSGYVRAPLAAPKSACTVRVACGVWRMACGVWRMACGVWRVACGVWCCHLYRDCHYLITFEY